MNQKGFVNILVIIGIVILTGVVGYFVVSQRAVSPKPIPSPTPTLTPSTKGSDAQLLENHYKGVDCTRLVGITVRPNNDVVEPRKDVCAAERAWFENNPNLCSLHSDPNHCYTWMAIKLKDSKLCNESGVKRDSCIKLLETTKNENTWHWDYIRRNQNPI